MTGKIEKQFRASYIDSADLEYTVRRVGSDIKNTVSVRLNEEEEKQILDLVYKVRDRADEELKK